VPGHEGLIGEDIAQQGADFVAALGAVVFREDVMGGSSVWGIMASWLSFRARCDCTIYDKCAKD